MKENELDKCNGALLGLAVGDALGTTLEFKRPGTFDPITDMVGGGVYGQIAGAYYGMSNIPQDWLKHLYKKLEMEVAVECLYGLYEK